MFFGSRAFRGSGWPWVGVASSLSGMNVAWAMDQPPPPPPPSAGQRSIKSFFVKDDRNEEQKNEETRKRHEKERLESEAKKKQVDAEASSFSLRMGGPGPSKTPSQSQSSSRPWETYAASAASMARTSQGAHPSSGHIGSSSLGRHAVPVLTQPINPTLMVPPPPPPVIAGPSNAAATPPLMMRHRLPILEILDDLLDMQPLNKGKGSRGKRGQYAGENY